MVGKERWRTAGVDRWRIAPISTHDRMQVNMLGSGGAQELIRALKHNAWITDVNVRVCLRLWDGEVDPVLSDRTASTDVRQNSGCDETEMRELAQLLEENNAMAVCEV